MPCPRAAALCGSVFARTEQRGAVSRSCAVPCCHRMCGSTRDGGSLQNGHGQNPTAEVGFRHECVHFRCALGDEVVDQGCACDVCAMIDVLEVGSNATTMRRDAAHQNLLFSAPKDVCVGLKEPAFRNSSRGMLIVIAGFPRKRVSR